ncbi:protein of unknown function [Taphrina deformans PYCC 5710]|uniref:Uncharacterized protein n=1 Tax=Taphrina deformans (strain PYCC 5710 / ATCC 11124 / CBS 356.35 / IMI 108563 / JCM 9778 / NBRC 8474) TaxID=1097556 RepID=R4XKM3_TAPDE|nr:protein of unknown function [Taphrina deformans PYCC 5710]|eukprot:CCG84994.1 protein of unknown function [Taphrina deformans PYCC 5710]
MRRAAAATQHHNRLQRLPWSLRISITQQSGGCRYWSQSLNSQIKGSQSFRIKEGEHDFDSDDSQVEKKPDTSTAWERLYGDNDFLLFGSPDADVNLFNLHPEPAHIFKLWQLYLENVDPLLKITHAPSLQARITEALDSLYNIESNLEALMFSIYYLRIDMKEVPKAQMQPSEAFIVVIRAEIIALGRKSASLLDKMDIPDNTNKNDPSLRLNNSFVAADLEAMLESRGVSTWNMDNPVQFIAYWMSRAALAKFRLRRNYLAKDNVEGNDTNTSDGTLAAIEILEFDSIYCSSTLIKQFRWMTELYFPMPAYLEVVKYLKKEPHGILAERCWQSMEDNYEARGISHYADDTPFVVPFAKVVLQAWRARIDQSRTSATTEPPELDIITMLRDRLARAKLSESEQARSETWLIDPDHFMTSFTQQDTISDDTCRLMGQHLCAQSNNSSSMSNASEFRPFKDNLIDYEQPWHINR